jgi:hypothetical protein
VSSVRYERGFYIPEDGILHGHCRGNPKPYGLFILNTENSRFLRHLCTFAQYYVLQHPGAILKNAVFWMLRLVALVRTDVSRKLSPPSSGCPASYEQR